MDTAQLRIACTCSCYRSTRLSPGLGGHLERNRPRGRRSGCPESGEVLWCCWPQTQELVCPSHASSHPSHQSGVPDDPPCRSLMGTAQLRIACTCSCYHSTRLSPGLGGHLERNRPRGRRSGCPESDEVLWCCWPQTQELVCPSQHRHTLHTNRVFQMIHRA